MSQDIETRRRPMSLLEYLRQQNWIGRPAGHGEYVGLCPLHEESRASFYVNTHKDVFYCHGCVPAVAKDQIIGDVAVGLRLVPYQREGAFRLGPRRKQ